MLGDVVGAQVTRMNDELRFLSGSYPLPKGWSIETVFDEKFKQGDLSWIWWA